MAKPRTEEALRNALVGRTQPLTKAEAQRICRMVGCSNATFYRSAAVTSFRARFETPEPAMRGTAKTKETMTKLRATIKLLANCVQALALRVERQEDELAELRRRANSNVTPFPQRRQG